MNFDCAVKLLRFDETPTFNTESINTMTSKKTNVSKKSIQTKRSIRISKKYSHQNNMYIKNGGQLGTNKKQKITCKKQKFSKIEPEKSITPQKKETKRKKNEISASTKSAETNSTYSEPSELSNCSQNLFVKNKVNISKPNSLKTSKTDTILEDFAMTNLNKDNSTDKLEKSNNIVSDKMSKKQAAKSVSFKKKSSMLNNTNKNKTSNEHVSSDKSISSKVSKTKTSRPVICNEKKLAIDNINKNSVSDKIENTINFVVSQAYQSEAPKSTKNISKVKNFNHNKNNESNVLEFSNKIVPQKTSKIKSSTKPIVDMKKKPIINKNNPPYKLEGNNDLIISRHFGRPFKRKISESDIDLLKGDCYLNRSKKLSVVLENIKYFPNIVSSEKSGDDTMMLKNNNQLNQSRKLSVVHENIPQCPKPDFSEKSDDTVMSGNDNKPPKIKNKWCDEWSGNKLLSHNMLKSNLSDNVLKTQKNIIRKNVKVKRKKKLNINIKNPDLIGSLNTDIDLNNSITNIPETEHHENISITNNITSTKPIGLRNDNISETVGVKSKNNMPYTAETESSSEITIPTVSNSVLSNDNDQHSHLNVDDSNYISNPMISSEINYGMAILSEAISRQCRESTNSGIKRKSPEPDLNEMESPLKKTNDISRSLVPSAKISPQIFQKCMSKKVIKHSSELYEQSVEAKLESRVEREIFLLSKRFNISIDTLKKTVLDEPLSVFHKNYSESVPPSMVTITPIVKDVETKSRFNANYFCENLDVDYKVEPIREGAAYEKNNLKELMSELSKTMPSWSLSIVTNPLRYVISHMIIDIYGIPIANKCIVLDKNFRASVYINQCLEHTYCKHYTTATEIVNLIKELNSI
ncbi:uncharacterized protein LOC112686484 [Sipha flava]|uniref:Uncharacterized protein LOC112686484 n=2 Tax=Sipha flava TaxID=143950 RepID=A0A8B8FW10_9HEMI|nr:uncharacterized protein LOC112686484 [Sipha flava]